MYTAAAEEAEYISETVYWKDADHADNANIDSQLFIWKNKNKQK